MTPSALNAPESVQDCACCGVRHLVEGEERVAQLPVILAVRGVDASRALDGDALVDGAVGRDIQHIWVTP